MGARRLPVELSCARTGLVMQVWNGVSQSGYRDVILRFHQCFQTLNFLLIIFNAHIFARYEDQTFPFSIITKDLFYRMGFWIIKLLFLRQELSDLEDFVLVDT